MSPAFVKIMSSDRPYRYEPASESTQRVSGKLRKGGQDWRQGRGREAIRINNRWSDHLCEKVLNEEEAEGERWRAWNQQGA